MPTLDHKRRFLFKQALGAKFAARLWLPLAILALSSAAATAYYAYQHQASTQSAWGWFFGIGIMLLAAALFDYAQTRSQQASAIETPAYAGAQLFDRYDYLALLLICLCALGLRLYRLHSHFPPMHGDEGEKGLWALAALRSPSIDSELYGLPLFGARFFGHPTLYFYMQAIAFRLWGETLEALRTMNAIFGALIPGLLYCIGRVGWGRVAGITAGWLMAVSHTYIHYSRTAMSMIPTAFAITLMVFLFSYAYAKAEEQRKQGDPPPSQALIFLCIGLTIGWSQYMYYGSRLLPVLAVALTLYQAQQRRIGWYEIGALVSGFLVIYLPQGYFFYQQPEIWLGRLDGGTGSANGLVPSALQRTLGPDARWPVDLPRYLAKQIVINGRYFIDLGDGSSFYWRRLPGFDPLSAILIWLGLAISLRQLRDYPTFVATSWACGGVFLAGVLTIDSPYGPRLLIAMPAVFLLAGLAMHQLNRWCQNCSPGFMPRLHQRWGTLAVTGLLVASLLINYRYYFVRYANQGPIYVPELAARAILAYQGEELRAYFLTAPHFYANHGIPRFLDRTVERVDIGSVEAFTALEEQSPWPYARLFLVIPERSEELAAVQQRFPGGIRREFFDHNEQLRLISYFVTTKEFQ